MGAPRRRKDLIKSRRRVEDDGEEEGSVAAGVEEDSLSEGSGISDAEDDADAEGSDGSDIGSLAPQNSSSATVANGHREKPTNSEMHFATGSSKPALMATIGDTEAMMNGLKVKDDIEDEGIDFEDLGTQPEQASQEAIPPDQAEAMTPDNIGERRRREHEEYKKKRDADPAFVPNRGGFFMHDHRSAAPGQNGFRPFGRGRGRGRGAMVPFPPSGYVPKVVFLPIEVYIAYYHVVKHKPLDPRMPHGPTIFTILLPSLITKRRLTRRRLLVRVSKLSKIRLLLQQNHNHLIDHFLEQPALAMSRSGSFLEACQIQLSFLQCLSINIHVFLTIVHHSDVTSQCEYHYPTCLSGIFSLQWNVHLSSSRELCGLINKDSVGSEEEEALVADTVHSAVSQVGGRVLMLVALTRQAWL